MLSTMNVRMVQLGSTEINQDHGKDIRDKINNYRTYSDIFTTIVIYMDTYLDMYFIKFFFRFFF